MMPTSAGVALCFVTLMVHNVWSALDCTGQTECLCHGNTTDCSATVTWQKTEPDFVDFELKGKTSGWVAVGFSLDKSMPGSSVLQCMVSNSVVQAGTSFNEGYTNNVIPTPDGILKSVSGSFVNGILQCRFQRAVNGSGQIYSLNLDYYLMLGFGPAGNGVLGEHTARPIVSVDKINVNTQYSTASTTPTTVASNTFNDSAGNKVTWRSDGGYVTFQLLGSPGEKWVAVAFSNDNQMGNDSVISCAKSNAGVVVQHSYNPPNTKSNEAVENAQNGLCVLWSSLANDAINCSFTHQISGVQNSKIFDLDKEYYIFLVSGSAADNAGRLQQHSRTPFVSDTKVKVASSSNEVLTCGNTATASPTTAAPSAGRFDGHDGSYAEFKRDGNDVVFDLEGTPGQDWVGIGFSDDKRMGDDCVISCADVGDGNFVAQHSYNNGKDNEQVDNAKAGITMQSATKKDGKTICSVSRQISGLQEQNSKIFDLNKDYHLMLGSGSVDSSGNLQKHTSTPRISTKKINVAESSGKIGAEADKNQRLLRAHGCLMITAWILLVCPAILLARFFRTAWPGEKICGKDIWFSVHRIIMLTALACTIAGFIIIFVYADLPAPDLSEFSDADPSYFRAHAPLGIVVMILVIINPLLAAFRCEPNTKNRPIFNWIHWAVGTCAQVIAVINVFFGVKIGETEGGDRHISHKAVFWILIAFVAFHLVVETILEIHKCIEDFRNKRSFDLQEYEMTTDNAEPVKKKHAKPEAKKGGLIFRYVVLLIYGVVVLGLWLAVIILVGSGNVTA